MHVPRDSKYCANCGGELRKNSSYVPESAPSVEIMEEQIEASKEKAVQVVENKQVRYSTRKSIAVIVGDFFLNIFKKREGETSTDEKKENQIGKKSRVGNKKKKNRKKKNR